MKRKTLGLVEVVAVLGLLVALVFQPSGVRGGVHSALVPFASAAARSANAPAKPSRAAESEHAAPSSPQPELSPNALFAYIERPAQAEAWERTFAAPTRAIRYVRIDREQANGKQSPFWKTGGGGRVEVVLPDGQSVTVVIDDTRSLGVDRYSSSGHIEGQALSRAVFAYSAGEMSGLVEDLAHGSWELRAISGGVSQWYKIDPALIPACGASPVTQNAEARALVERQAAAAEKIAAATGADATTDEPTTAAASVDVLSDVRILVVYTDAVANSGLSSGALQSAIDLAIQALNDDFARSRIGATASLAGTFQVSYADDFGTTNLADLQSTALTRLANPSDGYMDQIHAERNRVSADLVCLVQNRPDSSSAGIAYIMDRPGAGGNSALGFSVVGYAYMNASSHVFSHEIGHNLGCAHDRENAKDSSGTLASGAYSYSYGYRFNGADGVQYRTIMAYSPGSRLPYFSNPDVTAPAPVSKPVGIAEGQAGEADNARTIRQTSLEVANYRLSPQSPASLGTLVNVSTRAYVGTGAQQLIGGFVVGGTQAKKLLIRAVGPTLSQYGITDALADPKITLFRIADTGNTQVGFNDNWGSGANGATATDMSAVGAFSLPAGSRDSALVMSLVPGSYTANIEGVNNGTGTALIEAYEYEHANSRLVNLSTRGYATQEKPMIGGFVVQADPANPGKTKRVVIRVLGPTLAKYNVSGAMDDPMFELHDANQALILTNDDWSSGSSGGDDFKPYVTIYPEQQLAAVGLAPLNRRDSGVMLDLMPGTYTAVVKPFQDLPDQVQKPGIALVEVYEISQ